MVKVQLGLCIASYRVNSPILEAHVLALKTIERSPSLLAMSAFLLVLVETMEPLQIFDCRSIPINLQWRSSGGSWRRDTKKLPRQKCAKRCFASFCDGAGLSQKENRKLHKLVGAPQRLIRGGSRPGTAAIPVAACRPA